MTARPIAPFETDALIIGAGPVGLFQVFQLGLLGIKAHVVDALPHAGGQCVELYGNKPIYDIPAVQVCSGQELADKLLRQCAPMGATFHYGQLVSAVQRQSDGRFRVHTDQGISFIAKTIFIAAGVGAFVPRALKLEGLEHVASGQVLYSPPTPASMAGKNVVVLGGDALALETALRLCTQHGGSDPLKPASVTLLHRRDVFQAPAELLSAIDGLRATGDLQFVAGQPLSLQAHSGQLTGLQVLDATGNPTSVPANAVVACLGLSPKLGPIAQWGLAMERKQLPVDTEQFATSEPGIFAVGDINTYPGKKKLIVCGFHECVLAAFGAAALVFPGEKIHLQYTTTSAKLHARLGVTPTTTD